MVVKVFNSLHRQQIQLWTVHSWNRELRLLQTFFVLFSQVRSWEVESLSLSLSLSSYAHFSLSCCICVLDFHFSSLSLSLSLSSFLSFFHFLPCHVMQFTLSKLVNHWNISWINTNERSTCSINCSYSH